MSGDTRESGVPLVVDDLGGDTPYEMRLTRPVDDVDDTERREGCRAVVGSRDLIDSVNPLRSRVAVLGSVVLIITEDRRRFKRLGVEVLVEIGPARLGQAVHPSVELEQQAIAGHDPHPVARVAPRGMLDTRDFAIAGHREWRHIAFRPHHLKDPVVCLWGHPVGWLSHMGLGLECTTGAPSTRSDVPQYSCAPSLTVVELTIITCWQCTNSCRWQWFKNIRAVAVATGFPQLPTACISICWKSYKCATRYLEYASQPHTRESQYVRGTRHCEKNTRGRASPRHRGRLAVDRNGSSAMCASGQSAKRACPNMHRASQPAVRPPSAPLPHTCRLSILRPTPATSFPSVGKLSHPVVSNYWRHSTSSRARVRQSRPRPATSLVMTDAVLSRGRDQQSLHHPPQHHPLQAVTRPHGRSPGRDSPDHATRHANTRSKPQ